MFGLDPIEHDRRYVMADEFTTIMQRLWSEGDELTFDGQFWKTEAAFLAPKPGERRPFLVSAASSVAGATASNTAHATVTRWPTMALKFLRMLL